MNGRLEAGRPMPSRTEDYAIIGDTRTVGLVDRPGSIDWWCAPRIDSGAAFAALLGTRANGRWLMAPGHDVTAVSRCYEAGTLVLETVFETSAGRVAVTDFMPPQHSDPTIHRIVEGREGTVDMEMELIVRFEYGSVTPWVTATGDGLVMVACGDGLLSEEYDPSTGRMLGNFPQAFSHVALINTAANLSMPGGPSQMRRARPGGAPQPIVTSS
jgi:GH15 family glucan-1,4-alpha-glucosidase